MPTSLEQSEEGSIIRLEGVVNIGCAVELKQLLVRALASPGRLDISVADLAAADITAMQLLWAVQREAESTGKALSFIGGLPEELRLELLHAGLGNFPLVTEGCADGPR